MTRLWRYGGRVVVALWASCAAGCACLVSDGPLYREGATPGDLGTFPQGCRQVEVLAGAKFDDAAFRRIYPNLRARKVESINLFNTSVTDETLELVGQLKTLRWVYLVGTRVTPGGVARLREASPELRIEP